MALLGDPATSEGLRGVLLGLLWPENISLDEALAAASTHPVHERLYDSYHLFLTQTLPQRVESADLPRALEWATEVASRSTAHGDAADELLARAAGELSAPGVAVPAAHLLLVRHDDVHSRRRSKVEAALRTARENRVARRVLLEGMVASAESGSRRHYATFAVGLPEDFGWALGKACDPDRDTQERRRWVDVAWRWFRPLQCPDHLDTLWAAAADPIVQLVFSDVLKGVRTDSPMVDAARARLVEEKEWAAQTQAWERESEVDRDAVARLLSRPDADAWIPLSRELDPHLGAGMELRMERVAGWKELNVEERAAAAAIAQRWVLEAMPPAPIEPGVWPGDVAYALRALWLAADATEALEALTPEQWAAWGQILLSIAAVDNDDADERCRETLLGRAYSQVPEAIRAVLREELGVDAERVRAALQAEPVDDERQLDPLRAPMPVHTHTKLAELWDDGLLEALLGWQREQADDVGLADTVPFLAARGRLDAVDLALTALADSADEPNAARRRVAAAVALLRCPGGASYWSDVWSRWEADEAFGLAVVDRLAAGLRWELPEVLSQLDTDALADVYLLPPEKVRARSLRLLGPKLTEPADEAALTLPSGAVPRPAPRCPRSWR